MQSTHEMKFATNLIIVSVKYENTLINNQSYSRLLLKLNKSTHGFKQWIIANMNNTPGVLTQFFSWVIPK